MNQIFVYLEKLLRREQFSTSEQDIQILEVDLSTCVIYDFQERLDVTVIPSMFTTLNDETTKPTNEMRKAFGVLE